MPTMPDLSLEPRKVNTRNPSNVELFGLDDIRKHFDEAIVLIFKQIDAANFMITQGKQDEAEDIWRSQIMFLDSAFDFFLHELLKLGIISMFHESFDKKTKQYLNLKLSMLNVERALDDCDNDEWLKSWVNERYAAETFMSFEAFKNICNMLGLEIQTIADKTFYETGSKVKTVDKLRNKINELYTRRNQIAHQSDRIRENAKRQDISKDLVLEKLDDIKKIIAAIYDEAKRFYNT